MIDPKSAILKLRLTESQLAALDRWRAQWPEGTRSQVVRRLIEEERERERERDAIDAAR